MVTCLTPMMPRLPYVHFCLTCAYSCAGISAVLASLCLCHYGMPDKRPVAIMLWARPGGKHTAVAGVRALELIEQERVLC